jgi:hypothetical protein
MTIEIKYGHDIIIIEQPVEQLGYEGSIGELYE